MYSKINMTTLFFIDNQQLLVIVNDKQLTIKCISEYNKIVLCDVKLYCKDKNYIT